MSDLKEYYKQEIEKWDSLSAEFLTEKGKENLILRPDDNFYNFANRDSVLYGVNDFLGSVQGKKILEVGCGTGKAACLLAKSGANVTAFDISKKSAMAAKLRSNLNDVSDCVHSLVSVGESLPFVDNSFDIIYGRAILHHLEVELSGEELLRVLKPSGKAVFVEPLGMNPVINFIRDFIPYPDKNPVGGDIPLTYKKIKQWGEGYSYFDYHEVHFLGMIERVFGYKRKVKLPILHTIDQKILKTFPFMGRFYRYVVLFMKK